MRWSSLLPATRAAQIAIPADSYNGITVGAYDQADLKRWQSSAYTLNGGVDGTEVRGKPDILAPGVWVGDGISYDGYYSLGTSFAAPHVAGTAALLTGYANATSRHRHAQSAWHQSPHPQLGPQAADRRS